MRTNNKLSEITIIIRSQKFSFEQRHFARSHSTIKISRKKIQQYKYYTIKHLIVCENMNTEFTV